jgi:hypothetical protein
VGEPALQLLANMAHRRGASASECRSRRAQVITREAAHDDSGTLSGKSVLKRSDCGGGITPLYEGDTTMVQAAADAFLSPPGERAGASPLLLAVPDRLVGGGDRSLQLLLGRFGLKGRQDGIRCGR